MSFVNLGTRNKGTFWEYLCAYSFLHTKLEGTAFETPDFFSFGQGIANQHCHDTAAIDRYTKEVFWDELSADLYTPEFFDRFRKAYSDDLDRLEKLLKGLDFKNASNSELAHLCLEGTARASTSVKPMLEGLFTMYVEERFEEELKKVLIPEERDDISYVQQTKALLLTTPKASIADREESAFIAIEEAFWKTYGEANKENLTLFWKNSATEKMMADLTANFGWFRMEYMHEPFSIEDYRRELEKRLQAGRIERQSPAAVRKTIAQKQQAFFQEHPDSAFLKKLVLALQEFAFVLDHTKDVHVHAHWFLRPLLQEIASRLKIPYAQVLLLTPEEIAGYLERNELPDKGMLTERFRARALLLKDGIITVYTGDDAIAIAAKLLPEVSEEKEVKELKGIIAYPGIFTGKAVVVHSINDRDKFQKGDIFVTHDGSAEFNLFLQQAGAIVTNEGGMICHAAIVAREMKTPAIVGTRIATKVIKDGDILEVDATTGIVRILT